MNHIQVCPRFFENPFKASLELIEDQVLGNERPIDNVPMSK